MDQTNGVLKRNEIRMGGVSNVGQPAPKKSNVRIGSGPGNGCPQAKIIQQPATQAVIEITCGCGSQILLQCEIGSDDAPAQVDQPKPSEAEQPANA